MTARELIANVENMPSVSAAALKLISLLDQSDVSNDDVTQALKCDDVLAGRLRRVCSSPRFGIAGSDSSADRSVPFMGQRQILRIVLSLEFGRTLMAPIPGYAVEANELWRHSLVTANAAEIVAAELACLNVETVVAFTAGLLHDIGKLVLGQVLTPCFQTDIRQQIEQKKISRSEAERVILGTDHSEVGACLLQDWRLPEDIIEAVANHHCPVLKPLPHLSVITYLANGIAHGVGSAPGWDGYAVRVDDRVTANFNITEDKLENMFIAVRESFNRVNNFMAIR